MDTYDQRRLFLRGRLEVRIVGLVQEGVDGRSVLRTEILRARSREVAAHLLGNLRGFPQRLNAARAEIQARQGRGLCLRRRAKHSLGATHRDGVDLAVRRVNRIELAAAIQQAQAPATVLAVRGKNPAVMREAVGRHPEDPLRLSELRFPRVQRNGAAIVEVQVPIPRPVGHVVELSGRRPLWLEDRLVGTAGNLLPLFQPAIRTEVPDPQLGAVPGHVRVLPLEPAQARSIGAHTGVGVEVGTGQQAAHRLHVRS